MYFFLQWVLVIPEVSKREVLTIGIEKDAVVGDGSILLRLYCDIASIVIITMPWSDCAFLGECVIILSHYIE